MNVPKQMVQHSLMNDLQLRDFGVLVLSEQYSWTTDDTVITVPMGHPNWTKMTPTIQQEKRWAFRSMLWIRKDIEGEWVPVQSPDLTAAVLRLPDRSILVVSAYVEGLNKGGLLDAISKLHKLI